MEWSACLLGLSASTWTSVYPEGRAQETLVEGFEKLPTRTGHIAMSKLEKLVVAPFWIRLAQKTHQMWRTEELVATNMG